MLELGPAQTGFSRETLARGLDNFFRQLTRENFHALLIQEFGDAKRLDALVATAIEQKQNRASIVNAPEFPISHHGEQYSESGADEHCFRFAHALGAICECASGSSFLPRLFAHSIYEADPKLGACLEIAEWRGGNVALENVCFLRPIA